MRFHDLKHFISSLFTQQQYPRDGYEGGKNHGNYIVSFTIAGYLSQSYYYISCKERNNNNSGN